MRWILAAAFVLFCAVDARADVYIFDGDTIRLGSTRYRLVGIDAPELAQTCDGWPAGRRSAAYLAGLILGREIRCAPAGVDLYGRTLARCYADGADLGAAMVRSGHAWAYLRYSLAYQREEVEARRDGVGIHAHACEPAWDWRRAHQ